MKRVYGILPIALMAVLVSAADAPAPNPPADGKDQPLTAAPKHEELSYRQRMVTGTIADMKEADVSAEGKTENHLLAKVKTYGNNVVIVDFGPKSALRSEIKTGDEIAAFGITGRLNDRPLIVASKVATIVPIQGREEIFESLPVDYNPAESTNSNEQFSKEAVRKSNENSTGNQRVIYNASPALRSECDCR